MNGLCLMCLSPWSIKKDLQCYKVDVVEDVVKEVSPSESPLLPIEYILVSFIDTVEEGQVKEVEYVHVISKSETLSNSESSVRVAIKALKFKILEMKENPPQLKLSLLRKQPKLPDLVWNPLSSLTK